MFLVGSKALRKPHVLNLSPGVSYFYAYLGQAACGVQFYMMDFGSICAKDYGNIATPNESMLTLRANMKKLRVVLVALVAALLAVFAPGGVC